MNIKKLVHLPPQTVDVAQLVRALDCGSRGRGFESHHLPSKAPEISGAFFVPKNRIFISMKGILVYILILISFFDAVGQRAILQRKLSSAIEYKKSQLSKKPATTNQAVQTVTYSVNSIAYAPFNCGGTVALSGVDDQWSDTVNIGFVFNYFGGNYTKCVLGGNGHLSFDLQNANNIDGWQTTSALPSNLDMPGNTICAAFRDIDATSSGNIYFATYGTQPNRYFVACWDNIPMFSSQNLCLGTPNSSFQLVLYETSNCIDVHIQNSTSCVNWDNGYGIVGIQDSAVSYAVCPPNRNYPNAWTALNESWRFTPAGSTCATITAISKTPSFNDPIKIFPNPVSDKVHITVSKGISGSVQVYNVVGSTCYFSDINEETSEIDFSKLVSGIYFIRISTLNGITIKKIIKD